MSHPIRTPVIAAVLTACLAAPAAAQDSQPAETPRKGKAHTWSGQGSGKVGRNSASDASQTSTGATKIEVETRGTYAHALAEFESQRSTSSGKSVQSKTSYQLTVATDSDHEYRWTADGDMNYGGKASIGASSGYTSRLNAIAALVYTGDLSLRGAANLAVHTSEQYESEHSISSTPGVTIRVKRQSAKESDEQDGAGHDTRSGAGGRVRVDVNAYASANYSGTLVAGTSGVGDGRGQATNAGKLVLKVIVTPLGDPDGGGPTTPGGEPEAKRNYFWGVQVVPAVDPPPGELSSRTGHPTQLPGSKLVDETGGRPDDPKNPKHTEKTLVGTDEQGSYWDVVHDEPLDTE